MKYPSFIFFFFGFKNDIFFLFASFFPRFLTCREDEFESLDSMGKFEIVSLYFDDIVLEGTVFRDDVDESASRAYGTWLQLRELAFTLLVGRLVILWEYTFTFGVWHVICQVHLYYLGVYLCYVGLIDVLCMFKVATLVVNEKEL